MNLVRYLQCCVLLCGQRSLCFGIFKFSEPDLFRMLGYIFWNTILLLFISSVSLLPNIILTAFFFSYSFLLDKSMDKVKVSPQILFFFFNVVMASCQTLTAWWSTFTFYSNLEVLNKPGSVLLKGIKTRGKSQSRKRQGCSLENKGLTPSARDGRSE